MLFIDVIAIIIAKVFRGIMAIITSHSRIPDQVIPPGTPEVVKPTQEINLHIVTPSGEKSHMSETTQKIMKIAAYILIALGIALLLAGIITFGATIGPGAAAIGATSNAIAISTLGIFSLFGGCQLMMNAEKEEAPKAKGMKIGPFEIDY